MNPVEGHESPPWSVTTKAIVASTALILGALIIWRFQFLIMPLALAGILAYLLHPLIRMLNYRLNIHRTYVVIVVYLVLLLLLAGGTVAVGLAAADQLTRLAVALPDLVPRLVQQAQTLTNEWADVEVVIGPYEFSFGAIRELINWNAIADEARSLLQQVLGQGTMAIAGAAQATLSTLAMGLTVFFISVYISIEGPRIGQAIGDLAHQPGYRKDAERLVADTLRVWNSYLRGQVILAVLIFAVVSVALGILQVNYALALGVLSGLLEFLPIIGPIIGGAAAVLVAFFQTPPWGLSPWTYALIVLAVMVVIQQVEGNVLVPRMVGDSVNVHPLIVMIAVLMGASLAGLVGAVLAAPVVGTLKLLGVYIWRKLLDLHPFPEDFEKGRGEEMTQQDGREEGRKEVVQPLSFIPQPLTFDPIFKDYVWGGRNLARVLGRALPEGTVAESWEIAAHPNGASRINRGPMAGMTLAEATERFGEALLGTRNRCAAASERFPLLIKLLDAQRWLSVQVHPDDAYALAHEGEPGKTEMWVVLHAEAPEGQDCAQVIFGFSQAVTPDALRAVLESDDPSAIEPYLHRLDVTAGDVIFVPAGAVHALGPGIIVAEIQQNSDTTYRLYDWGRPREIHVAQALDVIDYDLVRPGRAQPEPRTEAGPDDLEVDAGVVVERIGHCDYFVTERLHMPAGSKVAGRTSGATFEIIGVLAGEALLRHGGGTDAESRALSGVVWTLLPANLGAYILTAESDVTALRVYSPAASHHDKMIE